MADRFGERFLGQGRIVRQRGSGWGGFLVGHHSGRLGSSWVRRMTGRSIQGEFQGEGGAALVALDLAAQVAVRGLKGLAAAWAG